MRLADLTLLVCLALLARPVPSTSADGRVRYDGHRVFRALPASRHLDVLRQLQRQHSQINFWKGPHAALQPVDLMVPPKLRKHVLQSLEAHNVPFNVFIDDVQKLIDNERPSGNGASGFDWTDYYPLENVMSWLDSLPQRYPGVVSPIVAGRSFEGRELRGIRISYGNGNPAIFVESGIHANEWITVATATFIANELLTSTNATIRNIAESFDWYVVPSTNPDGYDYTHTTDRMWRKTRSNVSDSCVGTDPNRNWDYHWMDEGASPDPCDDTFAGPRVFSEAETRSLSEFLRGLSGDLQVYLCLHSYSQLLMIPYGLNYERPDNYGELMEIADVAVNALSQRYGTQYQYGTIYDIIYPAAGGSIDWVKKALGARFVFEWELRDEGQFGMLLPADQIVPTALETLDSVVAILREVQARTGRA